MNVGQEPNRNAEEVHGIETLLSSACGQWMNQDRLCRVRLDGG